MYYTYIGFAGTLLSLSYRIPQLYKIYKTKSAKDLSVNTIHIQNISYILSLIYSFGINDVVDLVGTSVSILQNLCMYYMIYKYNIPEVPLQESVKL
jgi:MtN3 and saliva related transmembrane protein